MSDKSIAVEQRLNALIAQCGPVPVTTGLAPITVNGPTELAKLTVPGGTMATGIKWEAEAQGFVSTGGAPTTVYFACYWGPVGSALSGTQLQQLQIPAAGLVGGWSNLGWHVKVTIIPLSSTSVSVSIRLSWHTATGVGGSAYYHAVGTQTGLTTGVDRDLDLAFGYTGAGLTLNVHGADVQRTK